MTAAAGCGPRDGLSVEAEEEEEEADDSVEVELEVVSDGEETEDIGVFGLYHRKPCRPLEILLIIIGVLCTAAFTTAKIMGSATKSEISNMILGCRALRHCSAARSTWLWPGSLGRPSLRPS